MNGNGFSKVTLDLGVKGLGQVQHVTVDGVDISRHVSEVTVMARGGRLPEVSLLIYSGEVVVTGDALVEFRDASAELRELRQRVTDLEAGRG